LTEQKSKREFFNKRVNVLKSFDDEEPEFEILNPETLKP
jgi:hypothetical protein